MQSITAGTSKPWLVDRNVTNAGPSETRTVWSDIPQLVLCNIAKFLSPLEYGRLMFTTIGTLHALAGPPAEVLRRGHLACPPLDALGDNANRLALLKRAALTERNLADGIAFSQSFTGPSHGCWKTAISSDGARVATAGTTLTTVSVWNTQSTKHLMQLDGHTAPITSLAFSGEGTRLISASEDCTARVWDLTSPGESTVLSGHTDTIYKAAFSPDGHSVVTASEDGQTGLWSLAEPHRPIFRTGTGYQVIHASFSPDGKQYITASVDLSVTAWNLEATDQPTVISGYQRPFETAVEDPSERADGVIARLWILNPNEERPLRHGYSMGPGVFHPGGTHVLTNDLHQKKLWGLKNKDAPGVPLGTSKAHQIALFSPDGAHIMAWSIGDGPCVWDITKPSEPIFAAEGNLAARCGAFHPHGSHIIVGTGHGEVFLWDFRKPNTDAKLLGRDLYNVLSVAFSPDGSRALAVSAENIVHVWDFSVAA